MRITILSAAESDLEQGHRFYEAQADGLGTNFSGYALLRH